MASSKEEEFEAYEWAEDKTWQDQVNNFEFPAGWTEPKKETFLLKRKHKYYKANIDKEYEIPKAAPKARPVPTVTEDPVDASTTSNGPQTNPYTSGNGTYNYTSSEDNPSNDAPTDTSSAAQNASQNASQNAAPSASNSSAKPKPPPRNYQAPPRSTTSSSVGSFTMLWSYSLLASQWAILILSLLSLVMPILYYRALYVAVLIHLIAVVKNAGRPQMNMEYAQKVMQDENVMILFYALMFIMAAPSMIFLAPLCLRALFMGSHLLNGALRAKVPALHSKISPILQKVLSQQYWFQQKIAMLEVFVGIYLIISIFFMKNAIVLTMLYWQTLGAKYNMNSNTKSAFYQINLAIEQLLGRIPVPMVLTVYRKATGYLYGMVDPQRIAQMQQERQEGGGGEGGGSGGRKCLIM